MQHYHLLDIIGKSGKLGKYENTVYCMLKKIFIYLIERLRNQKANHLQNKFFEKRRMQIGDGLAKSISW